MCGINGFNFSDQTLINKMNSNIKHRGPDDDGFFCDNKISLGQVRLSIIDLSANGKQPMQYVHAEKKVIIVFNGEIYNFQTLKIELKKQGYSFNSKTDTEVIAASYIEYGEKCVEKFNGMWSFAIYDITKNIIFCSRDRLGVKPFNYYYDEKQGIFIFSSEIKGIFAHENLNLQNKKNIAWDSLDFFFSLGFIPSPYTVYKKIKKLGARENLVFNLQTKKLQTYTYYAIPEFKPVFNKRKLVSKGKKLLKSSTKLRMIADVPIGAFLSGGLDSNSVVGTMKQIKNTKQIHTFSMGFPDGIDETPFINISKKFFKTNHHHYNFQGKKDFLNALKLYQNVFDEPFSDFGFMPSFKLSEKTSRQVKVILTGDGGDEIFGGYTLLYNIFQYETIRKIPKIFRRSLLKVVTLFKKNSDLTVLGKIRELLRWSLVDTTNPLYELYKDNKYFDKNSLKWFNEKMNLCLNKTNNLTEATRYYYLFFSTMGDNLLTKTDRTTMYYGLEARSPFCDYRWIEFASKIPTKWKVSIWGGTKLIMLTLIKDIIPKKILNRKKQGFTPPFFKYIKQNEQYILKYIKSNIPKGILPRGVVSVIDDKKQSGEDLYFDILLKTYLFTLWYKKWIKN